MGRIEWKVVISPLALRDLEEIVTFIAHDDPTAAERFGLRLIEEAESLDSFPLSGRVVPEIQNSSIRERIYRSYRIVYRVDASAGAVTIARFWHAARGIPQP